MTHNHNLRTSYQTGFRYPTTQDQYIGLDAGRALLVGSAQVVQLFVEIAIEVDIEG